MGDLETRRITFKDDEMSAYAEELKALQFPAPPRETLYSRPALQSKIMASGILNKVASKIISKMLHRLLPSQKPMALPTMCQLSMGMTQTVMNQNFTATSAAQAETDNQKISHKTRMKAEVQDSHNGREIFGDFVVSNGVLRRSFIQSYLQEEIQRILAAIAASVIVRHDSNSEEESAEMKCLISSVSCLRGGRLLLNI
nr:hypothetical protein Iba_chr07eCG12810 [Ipomoea batatas]